MRAAFLAPRYWGIWLMAGLMRGFAKLPYPTQLVVGGALGGLLYHVMRRRRRIAAANLAVCFPGMDARDRGRLLRGHFRSLGISFMELGMTYWGEDDAIRGLARITGLEHLQDALRAGRGALLLGAHFTTLELGLRFLSLHQEVEVMYRKNNNPLLDLILYRARSRHRGRMIPRENVRALYRSLAANRVVWYAPDHNYGRKHSVFVSFFGHPAATITTPARFAAATGARVLPFFQYRLPKRGGYEVIILPPLQNFPSGDDEEDARRINAVIEEEIRFAPEQYLWVHRRFKTRAPGAANIYAGV
jgi:KDO2-lipid IV(A) lauroyltransferase